ncbi:hypothetical protein MY4038_009820 [Beauveria bassiana]
MKLSLIVAAAAAGLAAATPLRARQTESKRPFVRPAKGSSDACGVALIINRPERHSEACVGTRRYCRERFYAEFGESFGSAQECLDSREQPSQRPADGEQPTCDCSKALWSDDLTDFKCPDGYQKPSGNAFALECVQIGCSDDKYEAKCGIQSTSTAVAPTPASTLASTNPNPEDAKPTAAPESPKPTVNEQTTCDCSKPYAVFPDKASECPDGYELYLVGSRTFCQQIDCLYENHEAQCEAKSTNPNPEDAKPTAAPENPKPTVNEQTTCDCSKPYAVFPNKASECPDGYELYLVGSRTFCQQIGCLYENHEAQCEAKSRS